MPNVQQTHKEPFNISKAQTPLVRFVAD